MFIENSGSASMIRRTRQAMPGIVINTNDTDRAVILRNLVIRNWTIGLQVKGRARVTAERCRFDSNLAANISVEDASNATVSDCQVQAAGMRAGEFSQAQHLGLAAAGNHAPAAHQQLRDEFEAEPAARAADDRDGHADSLRGASYVQCCVRARARGNLGAAPLHGNFTPVRRSSRNCTPRRR